MRKSRNRYYRDSRDFQFPARLFWFKHGSSANGKDGSLYQFFAPGGMLSRTHPAYEFRRGQLQMAQAVEQALRKNVT